MKHTPLSEEERQEYIEKRGLYCPICGGVVEALPLETPDETDILYQLVQCGDCKALYQETYTLADVELIMA